MNSIALLLGLMAVPTQLVAAQGLEWPQFRGPNGDGHYTGPKLPTEWGPDKNVVWKTPIPGLGWSSPIFHNGRLYLTTAVKKDATYSLQALCVDSSKGSILWQQEIFVEDTKTVQQPHSKNSHASPTPITDGTRLYVHFGHMGTAALDFDGKILWKKPGLYSKPQHGSGGSPILVDDKLVFSGDGSDKQFVVALDTKTGDIVWQTNRSIKATLPFSFATCQLIEHNGQRQIISPGSDMVGAYDPKTGAEIWRIRFIGWSLIQRPIYDRGLVYLQTGYVTPILHAVKPDGKGDVTKTHIAWTVKKGVSNTPSYLLVGDELYMFADNGYVSCLNAKTGQTIYYERISGEYSSSPIYHDGKIWIASEQGLGIVLKAGKEFNILQKNDMKERTFASFVPVDGSLYLRTETQLYRFQEK